MPAAARVRTTTSARLRALNCSGEMFTANVYYMGRDQAASIAADLIDRGRAPSTPAWVVEAATTPEQRSACFTLQQMAEGAAAAWINPEHPSLLMIGDAFAARRRVQTRQWPPSSLPNQPSSCSSNWPSISTYNMRQTLPERLLHAWLLPRWMTTRLLPV